MSKTYTSITYQVVFSTKYRRNCLLKPNRRRLYLTMYGVLRKNRCRIYRIGGVEDHVHLVFSLHPSVALARLVKDTKLAASAVIKQENLFPGFGGWQIGYGAFTYSAEARPNLVRYVKNQEAHHHRETFRGELLRLYTEAGVEFEERYLE